MASFVCRQPRRPSSLAPTGTLTPVRLFELPGRRSHLRSASGRGSTSLVPGHSASRPLHAPKRRHEGRGWRPGPPRRARPDARRIPAAAASPTPRPTPLPRHPASLTPSAFSYSITPSSYPPRSRRTSTFHPTLLDSPSVRRPLRRPCPRDRLLRPPATRLLGRAPHAGGPTG